jgi:hypothetical protein
MGPKNVPNAWTRSKFRRHDPEVRFEQGQLGTTGNGAALPMFVFGFTDTIVSHTPKGRMTRSSCSEPEREYCTFPPTIIYGATSAASLSHLGTGWDISASDQEVDHTLEQIYLNPTSEEKRTILAHQRLLSPLLHGRVRMARKQRELRSIQLTHVHIEPHIEGQVGTQYSQ